jgi:hypothetical protein
MATGILDAIMTLLSLFAGAGWPAGSRGMPVRTDGLLMSPPPLIGQIHKLGLRCRDPAVRRR